MATPRRIMISGLKGGVGKTTAALNLAAHATRNSLRVLLVELDPQGNATATVTGLQPDQVERTIADVLIEFSNGADPTDLLAGHILSTTDAKLPMTDWARESWGSLDILPATQTVAGLALSPSHYRDLARILDAVTGYDLILMDSAPGISTLTTLGAYAADSIISITTPTANAIGGVRQLRIGLIGPVQRHHNVELVGVVANRVDTRRSQHRTHLANLHRDLPNLFCRAWLPERTIAEQAEGAGLPIHAMGGPQAASLTDLYSKIYRYLITETAR